MKQRISGSAIVPVACLIVVIVLMSISYLLFGKQINRAITNQFFYRQRVLARSEASNLTSFFQAFGRAMVTLSHQDSIAAQDASTESDLDNFMTQWKNDKFVSGILYADATGKVIFDSNVQGTHALGAVMTDRDYYYWGKNQAHPDEYYLGKAVISRLGASKGNMIIPVAVAAGSGSTFKGVLTAAVDLQTLTQHYLGLLQVSPSTEVYLLDQKGIFLFSNSAPSLRGVNVFDQLDQHPFLGSEQIVDALRAELAHPVEGVRETAYLNPQTNALGVRLIVYEPVKVSNQTWVLVMETPVQDFFGLNNSL